MIDFLNDLNEAQREAVEYIDGSSLVIAGAGSGKTRVLTYKIAYLLECGYDAHQILALTFTNKASGEMKERIASLVGESLSHNLTMGTFHSVFSRFLRTEALNIGFTKDFTIYDTADSKNLVKSLITELNLNDEYYKPNRIYAQISKCKNNLLPPGTYRQHDTLLEADAKARIPQFIDLYDAYCKNCRKSNVMDFDDLLYYTNVLFRDFPGVLAKYADRFRFILVDEYQDTNLAQYIIIKKLASVHRRLCVVGDDAQSIYGFRGARIENIFNFQSDYPEYKLFRLEQNYRSTQNIVDAANSVIKKNSRQISKTVFSRNEEGQPVKVMKALTDHEEGIMVAHAITESIYNNRIPYSEIAVLYRTNAQSRIIEEALRKLNVPYKIYGGLSFYQRKEVKDVLAYLRILINQKDNEALRRIINYPSRKIGVATVDKLFSLAEENEISIWEVIRNEKLLHDSDFNSGTISKLSKFCELINELRGQIEELNAADLLDLVIRRTGIKHELMEDKTPQGVSRYENVDELINAARTYVDEQSVVDPNQLVTISSYVENVSLLTDQDSDNKEDFPKVTLMTIHSAKGLEFEHVFLAGIEEGLFPNAMSLESELELEEERRLFYVAITRAKKRLTITYCGSRYRFGSIAYPNPSRFITEIDPKFVSWAETSRNANKATPENIVVSTQANAHSRLISLKSHDLTGGGVAAPQQHDNEFMHPDQVVPGIDVLHDRFGKGKVISTDSYGNDKTAVVFFENLGNKKILLKFARLSAIK